MKRQPPRQLLTICLFCLLFLVPALAQAQEEPAVRAVLFYSPTCPHCHQVINELLAPMVDEYGDALQILAVDVTQPGGQELYQAAVAQFQIPEERLGVPALVIGNVLLVGSIEIPAQFPAIVSNGLATGIDWPAIPGLAESIASSTGPADPGPAATETPAATATPVVTQPPAAAAESENGPVPGEPSPPAENQSVTIAPDEDPRPFVLDAGQAVMPLDDSGEAPDDPVGFVLAAAILISMVIACAFVAYRLAIALPVWRRAGGEAVDVELSWAIPLIAVLGIGVAVYLAYVELTQVKAICGPVGHCNLVQSSLYARILGVPIAVLGIGSYLAIIGLWIAHRLGSKGWRKWALLGLIGVTVFGTSFSIYLTLLELFVIRAVCAWCLTSAAATTLLMLLVVRPLAPRRELAVR